MLLIFIVLLAIVFLGGGGYGRMSGWDTRYSHGGMGIGGLLLLVVLLLLLFGRI